METLLPKNPFGYRLLWWQTLIFAAQGIGRAWFVLRDLSRYQIVVDNLPFELYLSVAMGWGILMAKMTWGIWRRKRWAIRRLWLILVAYWLFWLGWLAVFAQAPDEQKRLPFLFGLMLVIVGFDGWLIKRQAMQRFFKSQPEI